MKSHHERTIKRPFRTFNTQISVKITYKCNKIKYTTYEISSVYLQLLKRANANISVLKSALLLSNDDFSTLKLAFDLFSVANIPSLYKFLRSIRKKNNLYFAQSKFLFLFSSSF